MRAPAPDRWHGSRRNRSAATAPRRDVGVDGRDRSAFIRYWGTPHQVRGHHAVVQRRSIQRLRRRACWHQVRGCHAVAQLGRTSAGAWEGRLRGPVAGPHGCTRCDGVATTAYQAMGRWRPTTTRSRSRTPGEWIPSGGANRGGGRCWRKAKSVSPTTPGWRAGSVPVTVCWSNTEPAWMRRRVPDCAR